MASIVPLGFLETDTEPSESEHSQSIRPRVFLGMYMILAVFLCIILQVCWVLPLQIHSKIMNIESAFTRCAIQITIMFLVMH